MHLAYVIDLVMILTQTIEIIIQTTTNNQK